MRTFSQPLAVAALFVGLVNCIPPREAASVAPSPAATSRTAPWPEPPGWRLSDTVRPTRYDASLTVLPTEPRFTGRMRISLDVRVLTHAVWLHAVNLTIREATVNGEKAEVKQGGNDLVGIRLPRALPAGAATVVIDYSGAISAEGENGLFAQEERGRRYAFASMGPMDARRVFPCFDEPSFKVPWKIRLEVNRDDVALSNAPAVSEEISGAHKVVQFAETKPLPSYLLALAVGPFDAVDAGVAGKNRVPIRIFVPRGRGAEARFAKEVTGPILNRIEAYLDMPYPYEKLDFVDVPHFGGAMESPGLITFVQRSLLSRPDEETSAFQRGYATTAAHELAHQWFGNLVTMTWWNDLWLHEAFAPWMADRIVDGWKPEWHQDAQHAAERVDAMAADDIVGVRRLRQPMDSKADMGEFWSGAMYGKGAAVLDMFEQWIGRDAFRQALRRYLAAYSHGNASAEQFLETALHDAPPATVRAFASFLNQPGVPQVDASLRCEAGRPPALELTQSGQAGKSDATWPIPVCARYPGRHDEARTSCTLLEARQGQLVLGDAATCPAWVDANSDAHGYYRVRYLGNLFTKLLAASQALTRAEKVALLGDLGAQVRSGASSYAEVLAAASKLADDPTYHVAAATIDLVVQLRAAQVFPESLAPNYARFVRDTYGARAKRLGFAPRAGEAEDDALLRPKVLLLMADSGEDPALRTEAKVMAEHWLNGQGAIPPALVNAVLYIAARSGDRAMLDLMRNAARTRGASNRKDRNAILRAMGQFRQPDTLRAALASILTDDFDVHESIAMLWGTQKTPSTRQVAFDFVKEHYDALIARVPKDDRTFDLAEMVGASFCDAAHAADVESFFRERSAPHAGGVRGVARAVEAVKACAAYRERQAPNVAAFLTAIKDGSGRKRADGRANRSASSPR